MSEAMEHALAVSDLGIAIGDVTLVDRVGFRVAPGEVLALVGESGCGKSLTAQAVMRLLPHGVRQVSGEVAIAGRSVSALSERAMRRLRGRAISMIFQEPQAVEHDDHHFRCLCHYVTGESDRAGRAASRPASRPRAW